MSLDGAVGVLVPEVELLGDIDSPLKEPSPRSDGSLAVGLTGLPSLDSSPLGRLILLD